MSVVDKLTQRSNMDDFLTASSKTVKNTVSTLFHPTTYSQYFHPASYALVDHLSPLILERADLEERFRTNGSIHYYDQEREVEITPPPGDSHVSEIATRAGTATISQPFVGALQNVRLVGRCPVPVDRTNKLVLEAVVSPEVMALNMAHSARNGLDEIRPTRPSTSSHSNASGQDEIESAVLLYNQWNRGYFHWTVETLTRLEGVEAYRERTGEKPKLIVGPEPTRFQLESLALLGYDRDDLIEWDAHYGKVDRLIVPSVRRELNPGETSPVAHWWLHERMCKAADEEAAIETTDVSNRVYISREDADYRQILNEDEVLDVLESYGFEKYVLSDRSMAEDISLFSQADVIVAPHGAGLTNVLYSDNATVIELFRSNYVQPVYYVLSSQLGLDYRYLLCDYEGTDITVDVDTLEEAVVDAIEQ